MKKVILLLTALLMLLSMVGCNKSDAPSTPSATEPTIQREKLGTIETKVVFDSDNIKVTLLDMTQTDQGGVIGVKIENGSDTNITYSATDLVVNGTTITDGFSISVKSGETAEGSIRIGYASMDAAGMTNIATICSPDCQIFDTDTYKVLHQAPFEVQTSLFGSYVYEIAEPGKVCFENKELKIAYLGKTEVGNATKIRLLISNLKDSPVTVKAENIKTNGVSVSAWMFDTIFGGTSRYCEINLPGKDLTDVRMNIQLFDKGETFTLVGETGVFTVISQN